MIITEEMVSKDFVSGVISLELRNRRPSNVGVIGSMTRMTAHARDRPILSVQEAHGPPG